MINKNIITFDLARENDINKSAEIKISTSSETEIEPGDIDELIFPDEHFYISQR